MPKLEIPGKYRFKLTAVGVEQGQKTHSIGFAFEAMALARLDTESRKAAVSLDPQGPTDLSADGLICTGCIWWIGKDGTKNDANIKILKEFFGWNGDETVLVLGQFGDEGFVQAREFEADVKFDDYKKKCIIDRIHHGLDLWGAVKRPVGNVAQEVIERMRVALQGGKPALKPGMAGYEEPCPF